MDHVQAAEFAFFLLMFYFDTGVQSKRDAAPGGGALQCDAGAGHALAQLPRARHRDDRDQGRAQDVPRAAGAPRRPAARRRLPAARGLRAAGRQEIQIRFSQVCKCYLSLGLAIITSRKLRRKEKPPAFMLI